MTETEVNIPLLRKAVEWAEAEAAKPNPLDREWDQSEYKRSPGNRREVYDAPQADCGTAYCIAGWVCHINGEAFLDTPRGSTGMLADGGLVSERAEALLNIGREGARDLFEGGNTITEVRAIAEDLAGERL